MKYIFLAIFIVSTAFHLYASLRKETKMRNISKPFIILSLLGFYILTARLRSNSYSAYFELDRRCSSYPQGQ